MQEESIHWVKAPSITPTETPTGTPTVETLWRWLEDVPDPEIPVISVVDLGIVRDVSKRDDLFVVAVTPTYSGCPATRVISEDIKRHLCSRGVHNVVIEQRISPAWTTDWISADGHEKLRRYGIAPPNKNVSTGANGSRIIACPQCDSSNTERVSQFGSTPCKASYRCLDCLEPFDYFKCL